MSEETSVTICSVAGIAAAAFCIFSITQCARQFDTTAEARRTEAQKQEHELNMERTKAGLQYIERGSWIKVEKEEAK